MSRTSGAAVTVVLWVAFLAATGTAFVLLLRACRLSLLVVGLANGWNFCPADPPGLSADANRAGELRSTIARLDRELARKRLDCAAIPKPPPPPLDLPKEAGPPRPQQTAALKPPPPPADLPADKWARGDLSILDGCWRLGKETRTTHTLADGSTEVCDVPTGRICFGAGGSGQRETSLICPSGDRFSCSAPVAASFPGDTLLHTTQPEVPCTGRNRWMGPQNSLSCRRVNDALALCSDGQFEYEFRR